MKKLINQIKDVIPEQLRGMARAQPQLHFSDAPRFVWREPEAGKVAVISGGGSGHEPMHAGFVGAGMLSGACPGEVFTSPTPDQMEACARAVDGGAGVLLLVKNYTGDILNFETAVELLHADDIPVAIEMVDDDVAVKDSLYTAGRRGVAGTVLIEKLLGAASARGWDLDACAALARRANNQTRSFGVALKACTVPAAGKPTFELADDEVEFGVGIHGEPGIERRGYTDLNKLVDEMCAEIAGGGGYSRTLRSWDREAGDWVEEDKTVSEFAAGDQFIVLVNGLGGTPESELLGVFGRAAERMDEAQFGIARSLVGNYCTSLDMTGVSITLMKVDEELLSLWDAVVNTPALRWGV